MKEINRSKNMVKLSESLFPFWQKWVKKKRFLKRYVCLNLVNFIKSVDLPDVQSRLSTSNFKITRVGVTGVKKLVHIKRPNKDSIISLVVTMDLFVDLPASQKGSHMSRNLELVSEIIDHNLQKPVSDLESFCAKTAKLLLKKT